MIYELFTREARAPEHRTLLAFQQWESAVDTPPSGSGVVEEMKERKERKTVRKRERERETRYVTSEQTTPTAFKNRRPFFSAVLSVSFRSRLRERSPVLITAALSPTGDFLPDHR